MSQSETLPSTSEIPGAHQEMERRLGSATWTPQQKIALACRILATEGHESSLAGQVTARDEIPGRYFMLEYGLGLNEITASTVRLVDENLRVVDGPAMVNPANRFHLWIYRARPDVTAIVHTHALYASALSMIGEPLVVSHMDTVILYDDCAYLPTWPGVPIGDQEGEILSAALGEKRAALLAHHGLLATGRTIEEAVIVANALERAAHLQLLALAAGSIQRLDDALARQARDYRSFAKMIEATFAHDARRVIKNEPEVLG